MPQKPRRPSRGASSAPQERKRSVKHGARWAWWSGSVLLPNPRKVFGVRIQVVRSGGFAGLRRERAVETEQLPSGERADLERLVAESRFFDLPVRATSG